MCIQKKFGSIGFKIRIGDWWNWLQIHRVGWRSFVKYPTPIRRIHQRWSLFRWIRRLREVCQQSLYSARRIIGSRIIESAAYCNQILMGPLYLNCTQNMSVNRIIRLLLSLKCWPKVILLSGGHCCSKKLDRFTNLFAVKRTCFLVRWLWNFYFRSSDLLRDVVRNGIRFIFVCFKKLDCFS